MAKPTQGATVQDIPQSSLEVQKHQHYPTRTKTLKELSSPYLWAAGHQSRDDVNGHRDDVNGQCKGSKEINKDADDIEQTMDKCQYGSQANNVSCKTPRC